MKFKQVKINGKLHQVGQRIGKGGEGEVYTLEDNSNLALKIYTIKDKSTREQKISAMVNLGLSNKSQLVSFPESVAYSSDGVFLGFVMRIVSGHKPLHELYSPGSRKLHFPQADYRFLVRVATNIARAVASVHKAGCVIGDINHSGILISPKAVAALIDADSFQITTNTSQFLCQVGVPEYTPPELQGKNLSTIVRTANHDAFGLAVVIFQILFMGRHPFAGTVRSGESPPLHENIKNYKYVYTEKSNVGLDQPPGTPAISDFSALIAESFEFAFSSNTSQIRPSAENWVKNLESLEASLVKCDDSPLHYIPRDVSECPWCDMEKQLSTILFLPHFPGGNNIEFSDPGAANFNLDLIWQRIEAVSFSPKREPRLKSISVSASKEAIEAKSYSPPLNNPWIAIGAIVGFIYFPAAFIIWIWIIYWGFSKSDKNEQYNNNKKFLKIYEDAERRWTIELNNWNNRIGAQSFVELKKELLEVRDAYKKLVSDEPLLIQKYKEQRKEKQLLAFLDRFYISVANIVGIGPAKEAILLSYGIETAADVSYGKLIQVPGFGETNSWPLVRWRESVTKKFVYQPIENEFDRQEIIKIRSSVHTKLAALRPKLSAGPVNLAVIAQKVQSALLIEDPMLNLVHKVKAQAKVDLELLNIPVPTIIPPLSPQARSQSTHVHTPYRPQPTSTPPNYPSSSAAKNCPRCGSAMVKRLARRGRNAGGYFWGCSRYPSCKGTRNI